MFDYSDGRLCAQPEVRLRPGSHGRVPEYERRELHTVDQWKARGGEDYSTTVDVGKSSAVREYEP